MWKGDIITDTTEIQMTIRIIIVICQKLDGQSRRNKFQETWNLPRLN